MKHKLELISFKLCPYVQRAVIMLNMKKAEYKTTYIDLMNRPTWFTEISPLGKVPVLRVDDEDIIFESSVICEFLDETITPHFHPKDAVQRAHERGWMEFGATLIMDHFLLTRETDQSKFAGLKKTFFEKLARLEKVLSEGPFFRGKDFSLIDATFAPTFMRMSFIPALYEKSSLQDFPKVKRWADSLLALPEVKNSVVPELMEDYLKYLQSSDSAALKAKS